jgi:microcystin-dependent protein
MTAFYSTTAKYALRYLLGTSSRRDIDTGFQSLASDVETALTSENFPGKIIWTARATAPNAFYLLCDGSSLLRTGTYANLFAAIGTTYGAVDGTHFSIPDLRGRVPIMVDGTAARLTANDALGNTGGEEKHTLTVGELAGHVHILRQELGIGGGIPVGLSGATASGRVAAGGNTPIPPAGADGQNLNTESTGSGTAHNNLQPYVVLNALIHV